MRRGEIWWASIPSPQGSGPGYRRPVLIVQADAFNRSRIGTVVVVAVTSNTDLARAPGNVALSKRASGLRRPSVANVSQVLALDRGLLTDRVHRVTKTKMAAVDAGLRLVLEL